MMRSIFICVLFFFFKQKTAYEMRISDWSSDVCSSDLEHRPGRGSCKKRSRKQLGSCRQGLPIGIDRLVAGRRFREVGDERLGGILEDRADLGLVLGVDTAHDVGDRGAWRVRSGEEVRGQPFAKIGRAKV